MNPALKAMSRLVAGRHYDVLDNHADRFKAPSKEFVPRIKNTNSSSHLIKKSNYYQPPRRRNKLNPTGASIDLNNETENVKESTSFVQHKPGEDLDDEIVDEDEVNNNLNVKNDLNRSRLSNKSLNQLNTSHTSHKSALNQFINTSERHYYYNYYFIDRCYEFLFLIDTFQAGRTEAGSCQVGLLWLNSIELSK